MFMKTHNADLKPPLIDLEAYNKATGGKQEHVSVQPERLSEEGNIYCVYWIHTCDHTDKISQGYIGITKNFPNRMICHKKNKKKTKLRDAIQKYGWENLSKTVLFKNLSLEEALYIEGCYRCKPNIGWNIQKGGELGVDKSWYNIQQNKDMHRERTSSKTKEAIALNDTTEKRSSRAKLCRAKHKESYKLVSVGENNPKAFLKTEQVKHIKFKLIPAGIKNKDIANMYGVKTYVINFIKTGKTWTHIVCDSPAHE